MRSAHLASPGLYGLRRGHFSAGKAASKSRRLPRVPLPTHAFPIAIYCLSPTNLASWSAYFGAYFGLALVLSWFTPYLVKGLGFEQSLAGKLTALPFIVGFFVVIGGSWLSQRMMQAGSTSRVARGILCGARHLSRWPRSARRALRTECDNDNYPDHCRHDTSLGRLHSLPAILGEITPASQRGAVLAINSAVGTSAGIIAPYLMGSVIEGAASAAEGYSLGFTVCGVVTLVGGLDRAGLPASRGGARRIRIANERNGDCRAGVRPDKGSLHQVTQNICCEDFTMPKVIYAAQNGTTHQIELPDGMSVMQGALDHGVPGIDGDCGGECACGTCHVYVDSPWLDRLDAIGDAEASMLSFADGAKPNSRLACQIKMSRELDGLVVALPEAQH